jgi:rhodanese-related sulfurtransferase
MSSDQIPAVDVERAAAASDVVMLDVREYEEWMSGRVPTAVHIPMSELTARVDEIDRSKRVICVCRSGSRSIRVTAWLRQQGFDAINMTGGMSAWASFGHPLVNHAGNPGVVI